MNADYIIYVAVILFAVFLFELVIIYKAVSNDLQKIKNKAIFLLTGKTTTPLLEYKKPTQIIETPLAKHFQFKDIHSLEMIFDLPQSQIKDIEFTEDDDARSVFSDFLTKQQREKISYYSFTYTGYTEFLNVVEKKLKWKTGVKRKVLVLTELSDKKITFSHYLTFEKSVLLDAIDPEIFWGVDICVAVAHTEQLPAVRKDKVSAIFKKYDEIWIFEPTHANGLVLKTLGLDDIDMNAKAETEAYDQ